MKDILGVGFLIAIVLAIIGWVMNIITLFSLTEINVEFVLRIIGIFMFPIGAIYGWF